MAKHELILPGMGESVEEATIINWLKNEGDIIQIDDLVVEIATDKVDSEVPSDVKGLLLEKLCEVNDVVKVGEPIAIIEIEKDDDETINMQKPIQKETDELLLKANDLIEPQTLSTNNLNLSPLVRSISKKERISDVELGSISGTGKDGRITKNDLIKYISEKTISDSKFEKIEKNSKISFFEKCFQMASSDSK